MINKTLIIRKLLPLALLGSVALLLPTRAKADAGFIVNGGTVTLANDAALITTEDITLIKGSLDANASQIVFGSTWSRTGGSFTQGTSTVEFTGDSDKGFIGSTTFYRLISNSPDRTVRFTAGTTQYITNELNLQNLILRSTLNNATWYIRHSSGTPQTLLDLDVKDSNAMGGVFGGRVMVSSNSTDSGNNRNWTFPMIDLGYRYWIATGAGSWNSTANWSLRSNGPSGAQVPLSSHTAVFDGGSGNKNGNATMTGNVNIGTITLSGYTGTLNTNGYTVAISSQLIQDTGTLSLSTSPITLQGDLVRTGGNFSAGGSTITLSGGNNQVLQTNTTNFRNLVINKSGGTLDIADELIVTGQWTNTSGTTIGNSTVTFAGTIQQLSGSSTFYAMRAITGGSTLVFTAGTTQYATNMIDWENITMRSNTNGATWYFDLSGASQTIDGVSVRDSNARAGLTLFPDSSSVNTGNNFNWAFDPNQRYWVSAVAGNWIIPGNWSYASGGSGGAPIPTSTHTVIFDGRAGANGNAAMNGAVVVTTLTLSGYTGALNTQGYSLTISSAYLQSSGTVNLSTSTLDIDGHFDFDGGTFNQGGSTTTFTGTLAQTLTSGGISFHNVLLNKTGTLTLADALNVDGQFSYTAGTLSPNHQLITVSGDWRQNAANFTLANSTVVFAPATRSTLFGPTTFYGLRAVTPNTTIYFNNGSTTQVTGMVDLQDVYLRSVVPNATWYLRFTGDDQTIVGIDVRDSNAYNGSVLFPDPTSTNSGNNRNWAFDGDVRYWIRTGAALWGSPANWAYTSGGTGGAGVPTSTHTVIFDNLGNGNATLNADVTVATLTLSGYSGTLSINGYDLTVSSAYNQTSGTINHTTGTLNLGGVFNRAAGTFNTSAGTVRFMGNEDQIVNPGTTNVFFNLTIDKPNGDASLSGSGINVTGSLTVNSGTFTTTAGNFPIAVTSHVFITGGTFDLNNSTMGVARNWTQTGGTFHAGSFTVNFTGGNLQSVVGGNFNNLVIVKTAGTRVNQYGPLNVDGNFTLTLGTFATQGYALTASSNVTQAGGTMWLSTATLSIGGNLARPGGIFSTDASTIVFTGGLNQTINTGSVNFFNLVVDKTAGSAVPAGALNVLGNLTLLGGDLDTTAASSFPISISSHVRIAGGIFDMNNSTITALKDWTFTSGTVNVGNSTVTFTGTAVQEITSGGSSFDNIVINKGGGSLTLDDALDLDGQFSYAAGTFNSNNQDITVSGDWRQNTANLTLNGSVVTFAPATRSTLYGPTTFYGLRAITPNTTIYFNNGSTTQVTGLIDLQNVYLRSVTNNATWYLRFSGSDQTIIDVDVKDSNAYNGNTLRPDPTSTDSANNRNWSFGGDVRYWVRTGAALWGSPASWSYASGGAGGATVPTSTHTVIFDNLANGNATLNADVTVATLTLSGYSGTLSINGYDLTVSSAYNQTSGIINHTTGTLNLGGVFNRAAGTFNTSAGTVRFMGDEDQIVNPGTTNSFFNLTIDKPDGIASLSGSGINVTGSLTVNSGTFTTTAGNFPIAVSSHVFLTGGTFDLNDSTMSVARDWTHTAGTFNVHDSTVHFTGGNLQTVTNGSFSNLVINKTASIRLLQSGTMNVGGNFSLSQGTFSTQGYDLSVSSNFALAAGTLFLADSAVSIGGNLSRAGGAYHAEASTITFVGPDNQTINTGGLNFFNLVINKSAGSAVPTGALNVLGSLTLLSGDLDTTGSNFPVSVSSHVVIDGGIFDMNSSTITVFKNWTYNSGTVNVGNSTVTFTGTQVQEITSGGSSFDNILISKSGGSLTLDDALDIDGQFSYTAGTFNSNSQAITVNGDWRQNAANLTLSGSTVTFAPATRSTLYGPTTFYGLRSITPNTTIYFQNGSTTGVRGMLDIQDVYLRSVTTNATWYLRFSGTTQTIERVNVRDSNANNGFVLLPNDSIDAGNNRNWDFAGPTPITTLAATAVSSETISLSWLTPTDTATDPLSGEYAIQYATFTTAVFSRLNAQIIIPFTNQSPGDPQSLDILNLSANTTHYFRIWSSDPRPNWSAISNGATVATLAQVVTNLNIQTLYTSSATFSWTPRPVSPSSFTARGYHVVLSTTSSFSVFSTSSTLLDVTQGTWTVNNLTGEVTYYFRVGALNLANAPNYAVDFSTLIARQLQVELSTDSIVLGGLTNMNTQILITTSVVVTNRSNIPITFEFKATTTTPGSPWAIAPTQGVDQYVLWAVINSTQPSTGNFANEDRMDDGYLAATSTAFTMGNQDGVEVDPGTSRTIWFKLGTPTATSTGAAQTIQIRGRARVPD